MAGWIKDHSDGSGAVRQVEGETRHDCSTQLLRLLAAGLKLAHLNIHHSIERADLAVGDSQGPDRRSLRDDRGRLIASLDRVVLPTEELAVELLRLRQV